MREFSWIRQARAVDEAFSRERGFVERQAKLTDHDRPAARFAIALFPHEPLVASVRERLVTVRNNPARSTPFQGTVPDFNSRRTISLGVIGGKPISSFVGASGFVSHFWTEEFDADPVLYASWWHFRLAALLSWTAALYEAEGYSGPVTVELRLDGAAGIPLRITERGFDTSSHTCLEDEVLIQRTFTEPSQIQERATPLDLSSALAAAFNWNLSNEEMRDALPS